MCGRVCLRILLLGCYVKFGSADCEFVRSGAIYQGNMFNTNLPRLY